MSLCHNVWIVNMYRNWLNLLINLKKKRRLPELTLDLLDPNRACPSVKTHSSWRFPFSQDHARHLSVIWNLVSSLPSVSQQAWERCPRICLVIEWTLVIRLLWDLFTTLPQSGCVPEGVMGPQLTPVQKGEYQTAPPSVRTAVIQLIHSLEITQSLQTMSLLPLLSRGKQLKHVWCYSFHKAKKRKQSFLSSLSSSRPLALHLPSPWLAKPGLIELRSHLGRPVPRQAILHYQPSVCPHVEIMKMPSFHSSTPKKKN